MASRKQLREEARAQRLAAEQAARLRARRTRRLRMLGSTAALAVIAVVALVVGANSFGGGGSGEPAAATEQLEGRQATTQLFAGIPERDGVLGRPDAPVTLTEYGDLQCPACAQYTLTTLPRVIREQVRTGRVKLAFRPLTFIGPDSERAARVALGAAQQGKLWPFLDLFYRNQGQENSGYVTDDFLRAVAGGVPGLDVQRAFDYARSAAPERELQLASSTAQAYGITSTPSFLVQGPGDASPKRFEVSFADPEAFSTALARAGRR
jgi:protein-disulfide isomerase